MNYIALAGSVVVGAIVASLTFFTARVEFRSYRRGTGCRWYLLRTQTHPQAEYWTRVEPDPNNDDSLLIRVEDWTAESTTTKIIVTRRSRDFMAYIDDEQIRGYGASIDAAVGDLVNTHRSRFGVVITPVEIELG